MNTELLTLLGAAGVVILGTFFLKSIFGTVFRLAGLAAIAYFARRPDDTTETFSWLTQDDLMIIAASAVFGLIVAMVLNGFFWRESKVGRHVFTPLIAVTASYLAALTINLS
ncbi:MAG: hypothetical protein AAF608_12810 [Pseudomonadota bacterium]